MFAFILILAVRFYPNVTTLRSGISYRNSIVCTVRAPYSAGWNFPQCFFAILYPSYSLTSVQNFTEIVPGEFRWGLNTRGVAKYSNVGHVEGYISETVHDTASGTIND